MGEAAGLDFAGDYEALHRYSIEQPEAFWHHLFEFVDIHCIGDSDPVMAGSGMPGTVAPITPPPSSSNRAR